MKQAIRFLLEAGRHEKRMARIANDAQNAYREAETLLFRQWAEVVTLQREWPSKSLEELRQIKEILQNLGWKDYDINDEIALMSDLEELITEKEKQKAWANYEINSN